ncbi:hypothetical protein IWQ60_010985 [Tieghemiomyces parasiticus]|uniref:Pentacotripeptide-repeat region of PRORP domain-containing protein n=1 Tax=Tieghemiomyces parasiticus TaxID=78921 RepID=A0A9W7ZIA3_9FUNG|nr:hypothetical protein IWQ60_010985 [Tieghemiomyces parasiticus]
MDPSGRRWWTHHTKGLTLTPTARSRTPGRPLATQSYQQNRNFPPRISRDYTPDDDRSRRLTLEPTMLASARSLADRLADLEGSISGRGHWPAAAQIYYKLRSDYPGFTHNGRTYTRLLQLALRQYLRTTQPHPATDTGLSGHLGPDNHTASESVTNFHGGQVTEAKLTTKLLRDAAADWLATMSLDLDTIQQRPDLDATALTDVTHFDDPDVPPATLEEYPASYAAYRSILYTLSRAGLFPEALSAAHHMVSHGFVSVADVIVPLCRACYYRRTPHWADRIWADRHALNLPLTNATVEPLLLTWCRAGHIDRLDTVLPSLTGQIVLPDSLRATLAAAYARGYQSSPRHLPDPDRSLQQRRADRVRAIFEGARPTLADLSPSHLYLWILTHVRIDNLTNALEVYNIYRTKYTVVPTGVWQFLLAACVERDPAQVPMLHADFQAQSRQAAMSTNAVYTHHNLALLLRGYARLGGLASAASVDALLPLIQAQPMEPTVQQYHLYITALLQLDRPTTAWSLYTHMRQRGVVPRSATYSALLRAALPARNRAWCTSLYLDWSQLPLPTPTSSTLEGNGPQSDTPTALLMWEALGLLGEFEVADTLFNDLYRRIDTMDPALRLHFAVRVLRQPYRPATTRPSDAYANFRSFYHQVSATIQPDQVRWPSLLPLVRIAVERRDVELLILVKRDAERWKVPWAREAHVAVAAAEHMLGIAVENGKAADEVVEAAQPGLQNEARMKALARLNDCSDSRAARRLAASLIKRTTGDSASTQLRILVRYLEVDPISDDAVALPVNVLTILPDMGLPGPVLDTLFLMLAERDHLTRLTTALRAQLRAAVTLGPLSYAAGIYALAREGCTVEALSLFHWVARTGASWSNPACLPWLYRAAVVLKQADFLTELRKVRATIETQAALPVSSPTDARDADLSGQLDALEIEASTALDDRRTTLDLVRSVLASNGRVPTDALVSAALAACHRLKLNEVRNLEAWVARYDFKYRPEHCQLLVRIFAARGNADEAFQVFRRAHRDGYVTPGASLVADVLRDLVPDRSPLRQRIIRFLASVQYPNLRALSALGSKGAPKRA